MKFVFNPLRMAYKGKSVVMLSHVVWKRKSPGRQPLRSGGIPGL